MPDLTVVIPTTLEHKPLLERAISSVQAQTIPCEIIVAPDPDYTGAGAARNRGLARVQTRFVCFLDADDWIMPTFAERMLSAWRGKYYLYPDWEYDDGQLTRAPECAWDRNGSWHCVTTLLPTVWALEVGGFDESWNGGEDALFYQTLCMNGHCGRRVPEILFHYSTSGGRAARFHDSAEYRRFKTYVQETIGDKAMACCGNFEVVDKPNGDPLPGDILVQALWVGNRIERGKVTGRATPRTAFPHTLWIAAEDLAYDNQIAAKRNLPPLFAKVDTEPVLPPLPDMRPPRAIETEAVLTTLEEIAAFMLPGGVIAPEPAVVEPTPDVARVLALYNPEMALTGTEVTALVNGHTVEVTGQEVKVIRKRAPDKVTRKRKPTPTKAKPRAKPASKAVELHP